MKRFTGLVLALVTFASTAYAHNGMQHVMGTVTAISPTSVSVKGVDGKMQTVSLTAATKYLKGNAAGTMNDVTVGQHVVIHATKKGDALVAAEVKVGAKETSGDKSYVKMNHPASSTAH